MRRSVYLGVFLTVLFGPIAAFAGSAPKDAFRVVPQSVLETCWHYENRARFKPRDAFADFDVVLADSCGEALRDVYVRLDTTPYAQKRARHFLTQLGVMKELIITMNMERTFGADYGPRSFPSKHSIEGFVAHASHGRPISKTGEYLIAHRIGVVAAYRAWASATGFQSAALR